MNVYRLGHRARLHLIKHVNRLAIIALSLILGFPSLAVTTVDVRAAASPVSINMVYYGLHSAAIDQAIINANPVFLIGASTIGPLAGNTDINKFTAAGIKYFEYLTGGYETKYPKGLPVDLQSNLDFIDAVAAAGAYGIFFDEVSDGVWTTPNYSYLQQISSRARSLGLKIAFNTGVNNWVDQLMNYCDYIGSTEQWANAPLTPSQQKWSNQTWLLRREGVNNAVTAANLTIGAWDKGVSAAYATPGLSTLPSWLPEYISLISPFSPDPTEPPPPPETPPGNTFAVVGSNPVSSGGVNEYNLEIIITSTTVPGLSAGQTIWVSATTTDFPNLLTFNSAVTGDLNNSLGWWVLKSGTVVTPPPPPPPATGNTIGVVASTPFPTGAANEYNLYLTITSTTVPGLVAGQQVLCAASTTNFPNLLTVGATLTGTLDHSLGWWVLKSGTVVPPPPPATGNTTGTVASTPFPTGAANEYNLYLNITSTTVPGLVAGQQVLCAASTTNFPNLLTVGATLTGILDHSLGWWVLKKAN